MRKLDLLGFGATALGALAAIFSVGLFLQDKPGHGDTNRNVVGGITAVAGTALLVTGWRVLSRRDAEAVAPDAAPERREG